ncbi:MAG: hypothetical protein ACRDQ4_18555 [Pseudonocardiaceae bacterium]
MLADSSTEPPHSPPTPTFWITRSTPPHIPGDPRPITYTITTP